jgi:hypothetical protein
MRTHFVYFCSNILALAFDFFFSCNSCWVKRVDNMAAHSLAKLVPSQNLPIIYFPNSLSVSLKKA